MSRIVAGLKRFGYRMAASTTGRPLVGFTRRGLPVYGIAGGASALQTANAAQQRVARRPQTTSEVPSGPFRRLTHENRVQGFTVTAQAFGALINQPLKAIPGYLRWLDISVRATGGVNGTTTVTAAADAPWNVLSTILLKDAFGQPVVQCGGYELYLLNLYGGQVGFWNSSDPSTTPSFSNVSTGTAGTGNFTFRLRIPLELFDGFASIPAANASAVPSLTIQLAASATVYGVAPGTVPTMTVEVQEAYYPVPNVDPNLAPPDNGSSCQWTQQRIAAQIGSASSYDLLLPPLGSFVTTLILVGRDSTGARVDTVFPAVFGNSLEFDVDGVPYFIEDVGTTIDDMFRNFGVTRPTGVIVYTFRSSEGPAGPVSDLDSGDGWLPTTPGTQIELKSTSQAIGNAPATLDVISGRVYAAGGIPYTHLAE
jgi:hypothetical protein